MKNIFKIMGVALIASTMILVGCNKNEENPTNTTETTYTLTLKVNDAAMGSVAANPAGPYKAGAEVLLTATANQGYEFASWNDGNKDNPRTVTVNANATYTANFVASTPNHTTITFGTDTWEATIFAGYVSSQDWMQFYIYENAQDPTKAHVMIQSPKVAGDYAMSQDNNWLAFYYTNDGDTMTVTQGGQTRTDVAVWQPASLNLNIAQIDLNELFVEFTASAEFVNYAEYQENRETATWKEFAADVKNVWMSMNNKK